MGFNPAERYQSRTDVAYRTAVSRLRSLLVPRSIETVEDQTKKVRSGMPSTGLYDSPRYYTPTAHEAELFNANLTRESDNSELLEFIDKQARVINQLETDIGNSRTDLGQVLEKVEEVLAENEVLHERLKEPEIKESPEDPKVRKLELRCGELESELLKSRQNLRKAQEEILDLRTQLSGQARSTFVKHTTCEIHLAEIEAITRERNDLLQKTASLEQAIAELKGRETVAADKVKSSLDIVDQLTLDRNTIASQLKQKQEEIVQLQQRLHQLTAENALNRNQSKAETEKFYTEEIDRLKTELSQEVEFGAQATGNLESEKRRGRELRNQLEDQLKIHAEFRQDMQMRIETLEAQLSQTFQKKTKAEDDLMNMRLEVEKIQLEDHQEMARMSTELTLIRNQLIERNSDLKKCDTVVLALNEKITEMENAKILDSKARETKQAKENEQLIKSTAEAVQQKYSQERRQFEAVIEKQNCLMDKLRAECHTLAKKLEEMAALYKKNKFDLEAEKARLVQMYNSTMKKCTDLEQKVQYYSAGQDQMLNRVHFMDEEEKSHTQKIVTLLTKQSLIQKERERLESEVTLLRSQLNARPDKL